MIFIRYESDTKGCRIYDPVAKRVHVTRDMVFNEDASELGLGNARGRPCEHDVHGGLLCALDSTAHLHASGGRAGLAGARINTNACWKHDAGSMTSTLRASFSVD